VEGCTVENKVGVGDIKKGNFLVSDSFGPCNAVIARLDNGEFVIYHAVIANNEEIILAFKKICLEEGAKVKDIFVLEKETNKNNLYKAPVLAVSIAYAFKMKEVKRIHLKGYSAVICDASTGSMYICNHLHFKNSDAKDGIIIENKGKVIAINLDDALPILESIYTINDYQQENLMYFTDFTLHRELLAEAFPGNKMRVSEVPTIWLFYGLMR